MRATGMIVTTSFVTGKGIESFVDTVLLFTAPAVNVYCFSYFWENRDCFPHRHLVSCLACGVFAQS